MHHKKPHDRVVRTEFKAVQAWEKVHTTHIGAFTSEHVFTLAKRPRNINVKSTTQDVRDITSQLIQKESNSMEDACTGDMLAESKSSRNFGVRPSEIRQIALCAQ